MRKAAVVITLLLTSLLFTHFVRLTSDASKVEQNQLARKVNLALRRTAHHLLTEQGDSTSAIPPAQQTSATTFVIRLERHFAYDRLPALLQESLALHHVNTDYDVAVLDCTNGTLLLGYSLQDYTQKSGVPCVGREQAQGCHTLQVTFAAPQSAVQSTNFWWVGVVGFLLISLGGFIYFRVARPKIAPAILTQAPAEPAGCIRIGQTVFNPADQSINTAGLQHTLTYRETKLLRLFVSHPNQLLERDFILKSVWEDEGITVGRSPDVFVSRLRKILQNDSTLRIATVHGVGYRLEVEPI
ncbi:helix-turn-helix domain-containing protein [Spirosoma soli]|uniref:Helix-turn-helix domain-containing protein n=1 Tax=Spirosoma soli TaxID=1770529 RepID=A0ABW5M4J1_9BACT